MDFAVGVRVHSVKVGRLKAFYGEIVGTMGGERDGPWEVRPDGYMRTYVRANEELSRTSMTPKAGARANRRKEKC